MKRPPLQWQGVRVPWISPWSSEAARDRPIVQRRLGGPGIGYVDEHHTDRRDGVLWVRVPATPGRGTPRFAGVHALRQRQALDRMLCQVCGGLCERPDGRYLFLIHSTSGRPIAEGERTAAPPVHEACAREAIRDCPHLRRGWTAALVTGVPSWGVAGVLYDRVTLQPRPGPSDGSGLEYVSYDDDSQLRWVLAAREVIALYGVEPVDVDSLAAVPEQASRQMAT
ncbi:hypothetical protein [Streptomyces soliscabiei]|uniref:hypothetical protein n=1 Tax=Streptomyces soliscabiei TaxID=588897 RepID=UPI0029A4C557|nr:hypothetical protein [Streptomyces sp. NY05-11A]MDX2681122.1 hypothetical protein [Streptomyces sp. NY05-11A]